MTGSMYILTASSLLNVSCLGLQLIQGGALWLNGRASDSGARGPGFEPHNLCIVSLSKTL